MENSAKPTFDVDAQFVGFRGVDLDINERIHTEAALKQSELKYKNLVESSPDGIVILSKTGKILSINESFLKLTGFEKYDFVGKSFLKVPTLIPQEIDFYTRMIKDMFHGELQGTIEFNWKHANGEIRNGEAKASILRENDRIVGLIGILRDITNQKKAEEILKRQLDELNILQEISSICLENMDEDLTIALITKIIGFQLYHDHFGVMLLDEEDHVLRIHPSYQGLEPEDADFEIKLGEGVVGRVAKTNKPLRINNIAEEENYIAPKFCQSSELCVPISVNGKVFGVINAESSQKDAFSPSDERLLNTVADQLAVALQKSRLYQSEQKRRLEAEANREASEFLTMSLDLDDVLDNILDSLRKVIDSDQASIHLFEEDHIRIVAGRGFNNQDEVIGYKYSFENQLVVEIVNSSFPLVLEDALQDSRFQDLGLVIIRGWMGIPLIEQGTVFGYISVESNIPGTFNLRDAELVQIFANNAAAAIVKARLFENLQRSNMELTLSYDATIEGWAKTLELRDQETQGHSERVTSMVVKLARELGLSEEELIHIRRGALLHDVGKMGIPDSILQKPGKLTETEMEVMREHAVLAYNVLSSSVFLEKALDIPYSHHEKWDGTGYPNKLKAEEIPLAARMFAIIDVYDALRSDRPYRGAWKKEKTIKHIKQQSGSHFDPRIVEAFLKLADTDPEFNVYDQ